MMNRKETAEYALEQLKKAGADHAGVLVGSGKIDELNIDGGEFSLMRSGFKSSLTLKAIKDQKAGSIAINRHDRESIDRAVADCMAAVLAAEPDEAESIAPLEKNEAFTAGCLTPDRDALYDRLQEFMDTVAADYPKINMEQLIAKYDHDNILLMNTNGVELSYENGAYVFSTMFSAHEGEKAGSFNGTYTLTNDLSAPVIEQHMLRRLLRDAEAELKAAPVPEKFEGTLLVTPAFMGEFLGTMLGCYAGDAALIGGTSIWKDSIGKAVAAPCFTLESRPLDPAIVCGERFTGEGYRSANETIIENGILRNFCLSEYSARKTGLTRAANASDAYFLKPGEKSLEELIAGIKNGILINRFSGGQPGPSGDFNGVAKNSFLIRDGRIAGAVTETMISGNFAELIRNVRGISRETACDGMSVLPWAAFDGITVK